MKSSIIITSIVCITLVVSAFIFSSNTADNRTTEKETLKSVETTEKGLKVKFERKDVGQGKQAIVQTLEKSDGSTEIYSSQPLGTAQIDTIILNQLITLQNEIANINAQLELRQKTFNAGLLVLPESMKQ